MRHAGLGTFGAVVSMVSMVSLVSIAVGCGGAEEPPALDVSRVTIDGCGLADEIATGVATIEQPDLVLTVAHALSGVGAITVDGNQAVVLTIDTRSDLALLRITGETDTAGPSVESLRKSLRSADSGDAAEVLLIRDDLVTATDSVIERVAVIRHTNKVDDTVITRAGFVLDVELVGGDSGAPVIGADGRLLGIMYADAKDSPTSYAISAEEIQSLLDDFTAGDVDVERPPC